VNLATGEATDFLINKSGKPASATGGGGLERPIQLEYAPDGSLYLVDFGVINITEKGMNATPNTGVVWRVTRTAGAAMLETGGLPVGYYAAGALAAGALVIAGGYALSVRRTGKTNGDGVGGGGDQSMSRKLWVWFLCLFEGIHRQVALQRPLLAAP
jgi:hypothetical protein